MAFRLPFTKNLKPTGTEMDAATLKQLKEHGADLCQPRSVMHYLFGSNPEELERIADILNDAGWNIAVSEVEGAFAIEAERTEIVDESTAAERRTQFEELAASMSGGVYDGWVAQV